MVNKKNLNALSWYHANKDKIEINKEKRRQNQKAWYQRNKDRVLKERKDKYVPHPRDQKYKMYHYKLNEHDKVIRHIEKTNKDITSNIFYIKKSNIIKPPTVLVF